MLSFLIVRGWKLPMQRESIGNRRNLATKCRVMIGKYFYKGHTVGPKFKY